MKKILLKISEFFYPVTCSCCGQKIDVLSGGRVCAECFINLPKISGLVCVKCGMPLKDGGEHCYTCRKFPGEYSFDKMRSAYLYKDNIRKLVLKFKYSDRMFLARVLAKEMSAVMAREKFYEEAEIIIPVPLNIFRRIKRGYNQAALLSREVAKTANKPVVENVLIRKKITRPQFALSKEERLKNTSGSFAAKNKDLICGKNILLVDDIATTCSTVSNCAKTLKKSGAGKVFVITVARD